MDWLRHTLSVGRSLGFNIELVGPERVRGAASVLQSRRRLGALHTPDDGHVDPTNVTMALASGRAGQGRADHPPLPRDQHHPIAERRMGGRDEKGTSPANTWSTRAAPMRGRWANGPACNCR
jgi:glycine/D-amino acid oxidase-like deaminating enzyme